MWRQAIKMRTDGAPEEEVQAELRKIRLEEVAEAKKGMSAAELQRMSELEAALRRDRYKPDDVVAAHEAALWEEFEAIQNRVAVRVPLMRARAERQAEQARALQAVLDDSEADEQERAAAVRRTVHDTLSELEDCLGDEERAELHVLRGQAQAGEVEPARLERLVREAAARRIEEVVEEKMRTQHEVVI